MKNNQFKKVIRQEIEKECKIFDLVSFCIDVTNNQRMIYIYTLDWKCVGIFYCYLNNDNVHLVFTTDTDKPIMVAKKKDVYCKYAQFNRIIIMINEAFEIMDKEE